MREREINAALMALPGAIVLVAGRTAKRERGASHLNPTRGPEKW